MIKNIFCRQVVSTATTSTTSFIFVLCTMFLFGTFFVSAKEPTPKPVRPSLTLIATTTAPSSIAGGGASNAVNASQLGAESAANRLETILAGLDGVVTPGVTQSTAQIKAAEGIRGKKKLAHQQYQAQISSLKAKKRTPFTGVSEAVTAAQAEYQNLQTINAGLQTVLSGATGSVLPEGVPEASYLMTLQDVYIPTDPRYSEQWYIARILETTKGLWFAPTNAQNPAIVAVIDAGVDFTHEDIAQSKWQSTSCANERGEQIGVCSGGYDFVDNDTDPRPSDGATHGTAVASLIGAATDNELGIASLSRGSVKIMSLRVADNGVLETDNIVRAILFAVHNGAKMINMSFAGPTYSRQLEQAILYAQEHGVVMIVAAGNAGMNLDVTPSYPASYNLPAIITAGAIDETGAVTSWSNYGKVVDVFSPGARILAATSNNGYALMDGTSFSAPIVASYVITKLQQGVTVKAAIQDLPNVAAYRKISKNGTVLGGGRSLLGLKQPTADIITALQKDASGKWFNPQSKAGEYVTDPKKFTLQAVNTSLGLPKLTSPGNTTQPGPAVAAGSITFKWGSVSGVATYGIYVRDLTTNTLVVDCERCTSGTSKSYSNLVAGHAYRWNMNSWDSAGNNSSAYTGQFYFTITAPVATLAAPGSLTPGGTSAPGTILTSSSQKLQWTAVTNAAGYYVEFTNTSTGDVTTYTPTALTQTVSVTPGQSYKWRVRTKNSAGNYGSYSSYFYFQIQAPQNTAPAVPNVAGSGSSIVDKDYVIGFATTDPQSDQVKFNVQWDANNSSSYSTYGYYAVGERSGNAAYIYTSPGTYCIKARATDLPGNTSSYSSCHNVVVAAAAIAPTLSVTPAIQTIPSGTKASFTVATTNVTSCTMSGNGLNNSPLAEVNATYSYGPLSTSATYTIACLGTSGTTISKTFTINVGAAPVTPAVTFSTIPSVSNGTAFTLGFSVTNIPDGASITLTPSMGNLTPSTVTLSGTSYSGSMVITSASGAVTITAKYNGTTVGTSNTFAVSNGATCSAALSAVGDSVRVIGTSIPTASTTATLHAVNVDGGYTQSGLCTPDNPGLTEPYLISPGTPTAPGTQYSTSSLQFNVTAVAGAASYEMYIRNIVSNTLYTFPMTGTSIKLTGLGVNTQWRWNAAAKGGDGKLGWVTDVNYFTIAPAAAGVPTFALTPASQTIAAGGTASFGLATSYISSCTISGGGYTNATWGAMVNGTLNVPEIYSNTTYSFACLAQNGTTLTRTADVVISATAPKVVFNTIGAQTTGTVFPITLTASYIPADATIDLVTSAGTLHTKATTQYPITYTKNVTLAGTTYTGTINITSAVTGSRTLTAKYNGAIVGVSNSYTLTAPCTSSLSSLAGVSAADFTLESVCTPTNATLAPPTQTSPGAIQSTAQPSGTTVSATTQTFKWNAVTNATKYALYVRNLDTDVLEVNNENVTATSFTTDVLKAGAKYKWNVRAIDSTGKGGWISDGLWFTVQTGVAEVPSDGTAVKYILVDETNDPISNVAIKIDCLNADGTKCPEGNQLQIGLNPVTSIYGDYLFTKAVYPSYQKFRISVSVDGVTYENVSEFSTAVVTELKKQVIRQLIVERAFIQGLVSGLWSVIEGGYGLIFEPENVVNGIVVALSDLQGTGGAIYEGVKGRYVAIVYVDPNNYVSIYNGSKALGQTTFDVCTAACTFGAGLTIKGVQVGKIAIDVSSIANKPSEVVKLVQTLRLVSITSTVKKYTAASSVDDIASISRANRINAASESAYVVSGYKEAAKQIAEKFGWGRVDIVTNNGLLSVYTSPDELQRINYREYATSNVPGYNHEATLDLLVKNGNKYDLLNEVKFVTQ